jgi:hypothetical protein
MPADDAGFVGISRIFYYIPPDLGGSGPNLNYMLHFTSS